MEQKAQRLNDNKVKEKDNQWQKKIAIKVSYVSIAVNVLLSLGKLFTGIIAKSGAMISDGVHSTSDIFTTLIVILGVNISSKISDEEHPYGHERFECVASIILSVILFATGIGIGISGLEKVIAGNYASLEIPGKLALLAAISSILVKEWMYWYTSIAAKKINSGALKADAWHHRSDALSSIGAFIGILGARLGFPVFDPIASIVICLFIMKVAFDIFKDAINKMIDKSCDDEVIEKMKEVIRLQDGVIEIDQIKTRLFGTKIYVEIEILADGTLSLNESHRIAECIHNVIEIEFSDVKHCMVRVNPKNSTK